MTKPKDPDTTPDMRAKIEGDPRWFVDRNAKSQLLVHVAGLTMRHRFVPLALHHIGFDPSTDLRSGDPEMNETNPDYADYQMGRTDHIDMIICLDGGAGDGIDAHPITGQPTGSNLAAIMNEEPDDLIKTHLDHRHSAAAIREQRNNQGFCDTLIVRQMRIYLTDEDGRPTNSPRAREEKRSTIRQTYPPLIHPTRADRIATLVEKGYVFARVQAFNLSHPTSPRPALLRNTRD